jgi:hypothetical protein
VLRLGRPTRATFSLLLSTINAEEPTIDMTSNEES